MTHDIELLLDAMTLAEQASLLAGASTWQTAAIERLGVPAIKVTDGPNGARGEQFLAGAKAATFPAGIALAATWNTALLHEVGRALAVEARRKGARVLLAPTVNMQRSTLNGRNFECLSEDPCLAAEIGAAYIEGVQSRGVAATVKHFVGNESEFERHTISSDIDERTLREIYLLPFERAVKQAGVWAMMGAYNKVNGVGACEHAALLGKVLREDWGYDGLVMSDWWATGSTVESLQAGMDLEMPGPGRFRGDLLLKAVDEGRLDAALVRTSARRVLQLLARVGAFEDPAIAPEQAVDDPADRALIRRAGSDAMVLLRNDGILPLAPAGLTVAIIGPNAKTARIMGGGSASLNAHYRISPYEGLVAALGDAAIVGFEQGASNHRFEPQLDLPMALEFFNGTDIGGEPVHRSESPSSAMFWMHAVDPKVEFGAFTVRGSVNYRPAQSGCYRLGIAAIGPVRLYLDGKLLIDGSANSRPGASFLGMGGAEHGAQCDLEAGRDYLLQVVNAAPSGPGLPLRAMRLGLHLPLGEAALDAAAALAASADVALVFAGTNDEWDSEGMDRPDIAMPGRQDALISRVAAANPRTVVVLQTGAPVLMPWADEVAAIVQAWYPGQECGHAIADVLLGHVDPGGRLPQTFPRQLADDPTRANYPGRDGKVRYEEGLFIGYRHQDRAGLQALFPFGHGLSYTTFEYGPAQLAGAGSNQVAAGDAIEVLVAVRNSGSRSGVEVVQLYVRDPASALPRPFKELKAFAKLELAPGQTRRVTLKLAMRDLAYFDPAQRAWVAEAGRFELLIGASSTDIRSRLSFELSGTWREALPQAD